MASHKKEIPHQTGLSAQDGADQEMLDVGDHQLVAKNDWFVDLISAAVAKDTPLLSEKIALNHDLL